MQSPVPTIYRGYGETVFVINRQSSIGNSQSQGVSSNQFYPVHFPLTYKVVMCKQHLEVFPNQVPSFNPLRKEGLKWSTVARKPRFFE